MSPFCDVEVHDARYPIVVLLIIQKENDKCII